MMAVTLGEALRCLMRETQGLSLVEVKFILQWFAQNRDATEEQIERYVKNLRDFDYGADAHSQREV